MLEEIFMGSRADEELDDKVDDETDDEKMNNQILQICLN